MIRTTVGWAVFGAASIFILGGAAPRGVNNDRLKASSAGVVDEPARDDGFEAAICRARVCASKRGAPGFAAEKCGTLKRFCECDDTGKNCCDSGNHLCFSTWFNCLCETP